MSGTTGDPLPGDIHWPTPPQFCQTPAALYSPPADLSTIAKMLERLAVAAEKVVEILEAKPKVCPTCSRISGHQPWCGQGAPSG